VDWLEADTEMADSKLGSTSWLLPLVVSIVFAVAGYLLCSQAFAYWTMPMVETRPVFLEGYETSEEPERLVLPTLKKNLEVEAAIYGDSGWTLKSKKVMWLEQSAPAGLGNTIMYAHNSANLFKGLDQLEEGDQINVVQGGQIFRYRVETIKSINPSDIEVVFSEGKHLTLYTCDGSFDQKRLVVVAGIVE